MNAVISETIIARLLGFGMQGARLLGFGMHIPGLLTQRKLVSRRVPRPL